MIIHVLLNPTQHVTLLVFKLLKNFFYAFPPFMIEGKKLLVCK